MSASLKTETDRVREVVRQYLDMPESFPLVVPCPRMQDRLNRADANHKERRQYAATPATHSAFSELT